MRLTIPWRATTLAMTCLILPLAADARPLTVDDLMALGTVSDPVPAPDGSRIAYTVEIVDSEADESRSVIYTVSADGSEVLQMTSRDESSTKPRWSPDGRLLGFISARGEDDAKSQLWTLDVRGGEAQVYTAIPQGITDYRWSPRGDGVLLVIRDLSAQDQAKIEAAEAGKEAAPQPWVIDRLQFKRDGQPYLDRSRTHLYRQDARLATPLQLTQGDYDDSSPEFSPDGERVVFVSNRSAEPDSNDNDDLWLVDADGSGEMWQLTENPGADYAPAWSSDGETVAYVTVTEPDLMWYATNHLAIVNADGSGHRVLTEALDRNVSAPRFVAGGKTVYFLLEDSGEQHLASVDTDSGRIERPVSGPIAVEQIGVAASGLIALTASTADMPTELFALDGDSLSQLTYTNAEPLADVDLAEVRTIRFASADGTRVEGFVVTPPDYRAGRRYPTLLRIHGGPVSQYDIGFNRDAQLFAANGYVVVMINPRGSSGYGQDFSAALWAEWGVKDFADVMAGVDYVIEEGIADPDRLGVGGWSYGGILTNYVITKSERFKAAITGASEVLYTSNYGHDHYQRYWEQELGLPWENQAAWDAISPFYDVGKVTTPTLVMGGKEDWNVPINNSEQLYQALKRRGIDTQLVVYPDEAHSFARPSFIRDRYERYLDWYGSRVLGR